MKLNTKNYGTKDYTEKDIITFKKGIPGFKNLKKFILFSAEENEIFRVLHSIEDDNIGLLVISPFYSISDYEFDLSDEKVKELKIASTEEVLVLTTVALNRDIKKITTNLIGPIVINIKENFGEQIILDDNIYSAKHPLFKEES